MPEPPLLFDLDGTLVDSLPDIAASVNHVRAAFALPALPLDAVRGMVGDGVSALLARALPGMPDALPRALALYRAHHAEQCTALVRPFPGVRAALAAWQARGFPMAVVTSKPAPFAERVLERVGLRGFFAAVVDGDAVQKRKPDPEPCLLALRLLGAAPGRGTMIGDGVQDLRAGKAAGLRTVAVLHGYGDPAELRAAGADEYWPAFPAVGTASR